jgi:hypothetical protein
VTDRRQAARASARGQAIEIAGVACGTPRKLQKGGNLLSLLLLRLCVRSPLTACRCGGWGLCRRGAGASR